MNRPMVNAAPARSHVKALVARGMTQTRIAEVAGVTPAALSMLIHGHFYPGRPAQQTISAAASAQLLAVEFEEPTRRRAGLAVQWCKSSILFKPAGYNVGRCSECGELAPLRTSSALDGHRRMIVGHPAAADEAVTR